MDDAFVLAAAWKMSDPKLPHVERVGAAFGEAAMSVTITTLTDVVSFAISASMSNLRGVFTFCIFAGKIWVSFLYYIDPSFHSTHGLHNEGSSLYPELGQGSQYITDPLLSANRGFQLTSGLQIVTVWSTHRL